MRKVLFAALAIAVIVSPCFAGEPQGKTVIREANLRDADALIFVGKAESIIPADLRTANKSKIIVLDEKGNEVTFNVKALAVVFDFSGKMIALDQITKDSKVQIYYRELPGGGKEASAIKVLR